MKKIIILIFSIAFSSQVFANYSAVLEYGISGVENHSVTSSPKVGILYNSNSWNTEISWQHWSTKDGNQRYGDNGLGDNWLYFGKNIYSIDFRKNIFQNGKLSYFLGSGVSALEMRRLDRSQNESISLHRFLVNISAMVSYKFSKIIDVRLSSIGSVAPPINPLFGALNMGIKVKF